MQIRIIGAVLFVIRIRFEGVSCVERSDTYYQLDANIKDPVMYVNSLYEKVLQNDKEAINKVAEVMLVQGYKHVSYKMRKYSYLGDCRELVGDIVSEGILRIYEKRLLNFEGEVKSGEFFYAHLMNFFDKVMLEQVKKVGKLQNKEQSVQEMEESVNEKEHSINDYTRKEMADEKNNPDRMAAEIEERRVRQGQGEILRQIIANTKSVPHEMISFCYSMILPSILSSITLHSPTLKKCVQKAVAEAYKQVQSIEKKGERISGKETADIFYKKYLQQVKSLPWGRDYSYERFTLKRVAEPEIKYMHKVMMAKGEGAVKRERFLRKLLEEFPDLYRDEIQIGRESGRLSEAAKDLMGQDTIGEMSDKFENVYNHEDADTQNKGFVWGRTYRKNLKEGYRKYGHCIEEEGSLVYAEYFSHPLGGGAEKPGHDYLGENIRRYAERAQKDIAKEMVEIMRRENMLLEKSVFMKEYSEKRMRKVIQEIGDRNGGMQI